MKTRHVVPSFTAFIAAAVCVIVLSLSPLPGYATQQGPFADLSGDWSGGGLRSVQLISALGVGPSARISRKTGEP